MDEIKDLLQQGRELLVSEQFEAAEKIFETALSIDKKNGSARLFLGNSHMGLNKFDQAISDFKLAALVEETAAEANYSLACAYFVKGDVVAAIKQFNKCEQLGMASVDMYGMMSVIYMDANEPIQAIRCVNRAIQLEPLNPQPRLDKAQIYVTQGMNKEAINALKEIEDIMPDVADAYAIEAELYVNMGEGDNAVKAVGRAIDRFPEDPNLYVVSARVLNSLQRYEEALGALNKADCLSGDASMGSSRDVGMQKSIAYAGLKEIDKSIDSLRKVHEENPLDADLIFVLMNECYSEKRFDEAKRAAVSLLELSNLDERYRAAALFTDVMCDKELNKDGEYEEKLIELAKQLRKITIASPGMMDVYVYRLLVYKELKQFEKAFDLADHLIKIMPNSAVGYAFKADIAKAQGDETAAASYMQKALEIDPDFKF